MSKAKRDGQDPQSVTNGGGPSLFDAAATQECVIRLAPCPPHHYNHAVERRSRNYPRAKPFLVVEWTLSSSDRRTLRRTIAEKWSDEDPHTNYRYNVEQCADGKRVYLLRPTWLNKGFDFQVNVEGLVKVLKPARGPTREMPSHGDLVHDLRSKLAKRPDDAAVLFEAIGAVYNCGDPATIVGQMPRLTALKEGWPVDQLLYTIKWLMIEQDITYWLQTGRDMLMSGIETDVFELPVRSLVV